MLSAVSLGAIAITNDEKQQALTGKTGVEAMRQAAEASQAIKKAVFYEAV